MAKILDERRREPREDIISDLALAELDGEHLSDDEIFSFVRLLLPAGVETTFRSTGNLLFTLLSHPDQLEAVRADRSLVPQAIEEALRFETPLLNITRLATRDTEVGGVPVPAGSTVMIMIAAANRDETRYPDPDRFDIFRSDPKPHISFGHGPHVCLGMHLARMETRVALDLLLDRLLRPASRPGSGRSAHPRARCSDPRPRSRCCSTDPFADRSREEQTMNIDDLILVSVDDHVVEPPDMFDGHIPAKYKDRAPRVITKDDGTDAWVFEGQEATNVGLNAVAGRPPDEYGVEPTRFTEMRPGCFDIHERIRDMNANGVLASMNFPSYPQFCGQYFARAEDKDLALAVLRAYNDWHIDEWCGTYPGRMIPLSLPPIWDVDGWPTRSAGSPRRVATR